MKRPHRRLFRACALLATPAGPIMAGLALVWMASAPSTAWGQSTWPGYPNNGAISVTSGGNVGIGTSSPSANLDVGSGTGWIRLRLNGGSTNASDGAAIAIENGSYGYVFDLGNYSAVFGGPYNPMAALYTPAGLTIPYGNVGIGTTNPGAYRLAVEGTIGARDLMVTSSPWSDYVFRPGYRLRPLSEVKAFIQQHHHLPDIPSESEVKQKGVSVGEMQAKLLAKIEELTLHMIQQEKDNRELRDLVSQQQKENQRLRERIMQVETRTSADRTPLVS